MPYKPERLWSPTGAPKLGTSLKVLQWNILADGLAQHGDFVRVRSIDTLFKPGLRGRVEYEATGF